jgi:hypothetical protein
LKVGVWGWVRDLGSEARPYICEIPIRDTYKIVNETRPIGIIIIKILILQHNNIYFKIY